MMGNTLTKSSMFTDKADDSQVVVMFLLSDLTTVQVHFSCSGSGSSP